MVQVVEAWASDRTVFLSGIPKDYLERSTGEGFMTTTGTFVDSVPGADKPWYGLDNDGENFPGNQTGVMRPPYRGIEHARDAVLYDRPGSNLRDQMSFSFQSCAICKSGKQANQSYGCLTWGFSANDGIVTSHIPYHSAISDGYFTEAVKLWNEQAKPENQLPCVIPSWHRP
jgi:hypothetical protein